ncbi:MAG: hypothetical protein BWY09_02845 [Candidatus Hydrogenedentes bacterium ADurb.Bin179]|nr:MAG: hypothetical protein BWY09_02845 [Candidatus Hydrogenedentes bacterium ADurb.Bin179]
MSRRLHFLSHPPETQAMEQEPVVNATLQGAVVQAVWQYLPLKFDLWEVAQKPSLQSFQNSLYPQ